MTNQVKAGLITAGLLSVGAMALGLIQVIVNYLTTEQILNVFVVGLASFMIWCIYQITLSRLDYEERLNKLNESIKK